jgi:cbb3-type cytochrome oxidase maturation protein
MSVIYLVLPLAVLLSGAAVLAFIWAARRGQLDDLRTPAVRILHDDPLPPRQSRPGEPRWPKPKSPSDAT